VELLPDSLVGYPKPELPPRYPASEVLTKTLRPPSSRCRTSKAYAWSRVLLTMDARDRNRSGTSCISAARRGSAWMASRAPPCRKAVGSRRSASSHGAKVAGNDCGSSKADKNPVRLDKAPSLPGPMVILWPEHRIVDGDCRRKLSLDTNAGRGKQPHTPRLEPTAKA
jgi:hypothetical protein